MIKYYCDYCGIDITPVKNIDSFDKSPACGRYVEHVCDKCYDAETSMNIKLLTERHEKELELEEWFSSRKRELVKECLKG